MISASLIFVSRSLVPGGAGSGGAADSRAGRRDSNFGALHAAANFTSGRRKQLNYKLQLQLNSFDDSSFYTYGTLDGRMEGRSDAADTLYTTSQSAQTP